MYRRLPVALTVLLVLAGGVPPAAARTKLAALPEREAAVIRLDSPEATLIQEDRVLTLQAGENWVDFSWRGVQIDAASIRLTPLTHPEQVTLLSVAYPPGEDALTWRIHAAEAGEERVRITYLLGAIDRLLTYKAVLSRDETALELQGFLVLRNFSGEDFDLAEVDLGGGDVLRRAVAHEQTRQSRWFGAAEVPVTKTFTWDAAQQPWEPRRVGYDVGIPVHYVVRNEAAAGLGAHALWAGKVRVFQEEGDGGSLFLGEDRIPYTPVGEEAEIRIGDSRELAVTQHKTRDQRINPRPSRQRVLLYDTDEEIRAEVENFKDTPVTVDLVQHIPGQWDMVEATAPYDMEDAGTLVFHLPVPAAGKAELRFRYHRRNLRP